VGYSRALQARWNILVHWGIEIACVRCILSWSVACSAWACQCGVWSGSCSHLEEILSEQLLLWIFCFWWSLSTVWHVIPTTRPCVQVNFNVDGTIVVEGVPVEEKAGSHDEKGPDSVNTKVLD
jgi:hypothetical protein